MISAIVTDIEGTTTSVSFVYDVLFPYAHQHLPSYITDNMTDEKVTEQLELINKEVGTTLTIEEAIAQLLQWMDEDKKVTPLKTLQGMVWEKGYESGGFRGHVFDDVPPNLEKWYSMNIPVYIYSSGSIKAQKLLFSHTSSGDLTPWLSGYFDTTTGDKKAPGSYIIIADSITQSPENILFLSDTVAELDAADKAGMQRLLLNRDSKQPMNNSTHPSITTFNQIQVA